MAVSACIALIKAAAGSVLVWVVGPAGEVVRGFVSEATAVVEVALEKLDAQDGKDGYEK